MIHIKNVLMHSHLPLQHDAVAKYLQSNATDWPTCDEKSPGFLTCIMAFRCSSNCANKLSTFSVFVASFAEGKSIHRSALKTKDLPTKNSFKDDFGNSFCVFEVYLKI